MASASLVPSRFDGRHLGSFVAVLLLATLVGAGSGVASAVFLESLAFVTRVHGDHPWLLYLLPAAGALIAWTYAGYGRVAAAGNNLILDQIHEPSSAGVPLRMLPLILGSTLLTHLFGGSAGREGTAVQMGGAIGGELARRLRLTAIDTRLMLMCGVSGGFGSVFGTPLAGAVFGMEVLAIGGIRYDALLPCLVAAVAGDVLVRLIGVDHIHYAVSSAIPELSTEMALQVAALGIAFGITSRCFSELTATIERLSRAWLSQPITRTAAGGVLVIAATLLLGSRDYNGLSLPLLEAAFTPGGVVALAFLAKLVLTSITLGFGFKGGEVTPLFVIGATLGHTLADPLNLPVDVAAALGLVGVFAAAANTPIACVILGAELFGGDLVVYLGISTFIAYTISGHHGIYRAQRFLAPKHGPRAAMARNAKGESAG